MYIEEAHPSDEWQLLSNEKEGVCYLQPKTTQARVQVAKQFLSRNPEMTEMVVDLIDNNTGLAFAAWPERLYIIHNQKIAYVGGLGPFNYKLEEVERWLEARAP